MKVELAKIKNTQPRREHGNITDLKVSIADVGLINPLTIDENYNLLAGRRRYQALKELGWKDVDVRTMPINSDEAKAFLISVHENLKRKSMTDPEMATTFRDYDKIKREQYGNQPSGRHSSSSDSEEDGWSLQKSCDDWGIGLTTGHTAIKIATAIEENPDLVTMPSGNRILSEYKHRELIKNPIPFPEGKYGSILIDPPWSRDDENDADQFGRASPTYGTMSFGEIKALPVPELALPDSHLYLWVTNRSLPKSFLLLEYWGYRYITLLTWCKPYFGTGNYFRGQTEHIAFGVKGSCPILRHNIGTWFVTDNKKEHSSKPDEIHKIIEVCSPKPWLEMFARKQRTDWATWGDEIG